MRFGHARITTCIIPVARVPTTTTSNLGQSNKLLRFASVVWKNTFVCGGGGVIVLVQAKYNIFFHHTSQCSLLVWFHCIAHLFPCRQLTQTHATHTPMLFERVADSNALCTNAHIQHTYAVCMKAPACVIGRQHAAIPYCMFVCDGWAHRRWSATGCTVTRAHYMDILINTEIQLYYCILVYVMMMMTMWMALVGGGLLVARFSCELQQRAWHTFIRCLVYCWWYIVDDATKVLWGNIVMENVYVSDASTISWLRSNIIFEENIKIHANHSNLWMRRAFCVYIKTEFIDWSTNSGSHNIGNSFETNELIDPNNIYSYFIRSGIWRQQLQHWQFKFR